MKNRKFRQIQLGILMLFTAVVVALSVVLTGSFLKHTTKTLGDYVSTLISADSRQLELNIDSYLQKVENTVALLFSDERYYNFDATDSSLSTYDKIQAENEIEKEIVRLGLMENFSDFGVVYANDENIGMISQVTNAMFPDGGLYDEFSASISREKTMDGWSFGHQGNRDRLYYTKRLNKNAIALISFYGRELENVFELPEQLESMTIRLVNDQDQILYSSDDDEVGETLDGDIADQIENLDSSATVMSREYLINCNECSNGWRVVCTIPMLALMKENTELRIQMIGIVTIIALAALAAGISFYLRMSHSMAGMVDDLNEKAEHDLLTGLLNKQTFEESVSRKLSANSDAGAGTFIILDLDHFKNINDTLGHARGDDVLRSVGMLMRTVFPKDFLLGRIGGDEFAAFSISPEEDSSKAETKARELMDGFYRAFEDEFGEERQQVDVSFSAGVAVVGSGKYTFDALYRKADECLYASKRSGRGRATYER